MATVSRTVIEIAEQAEMLTPEQQLYLIALLAGKAQRAVQFSPVRRRWREICGAAPYPAVGEDAQVWVSRTRQEDDEDRERRWRRRL